MRLARFAALALAALAPFAARATPSFNPCILPMNIPAASGSLADVQAALAGGHCGGAAIDGDAIVIPPGTWTWVPPNYQFNSVLSVTAAVTFQGATFGGGTRINGGAQFDVLVPQGRGAVTFDHLDLDDEFITGAPIIAIEVNSAVRFSSSTLAGTQAVGFDVRGPMSTLTLVNSTVYGLGEAIVAESASGQQSMIGIFGSTITANNVGVDVNVLPGDILQRDPLGFSAQVFMAGSIVGGNKVDFTNTFFQDAYIFQGPSLVGSDPWHDYVQTNPATREIGGPFTLGDARLGPLTNNGGFTRTCAPLDGSPAIAAMLTSSLTDGIGGVGGNPIANDQRDRSRGAITSFGAVDVGQDALQALSSIESQIAALAPPGGTASQSSVNALAATDASLQSTVNALAATDASLQTGMNTLLSDLNGVSFGALANLDAAVSSRASQTSVAAVSQGVTALTGSVAGLSGNVASLSGGVASLTSSVASLSGGVAAIGANVDAKVSSRASQASVDALSAVVTTNLDAKVSSRASALDAELLVQGYIEATLASGVAPVSLFLPQAFGGQLERVQATVHGDLAALMAAGLPMPSGALAALKNGDTAYANKSWLAAYTYYSSAYRQAAPH